MIFMKDLSRHDGEGSDALPPPRVGIVSSHEQRPPLSLWDGDELIRVGAALAFLAGAHEINLDRLRKQIHIL
jgi:hypothetical protein